MAMTKPAAKIATPANGPATYFVAEPVKVEVGAATSAPPVRLAVNETVALPSQPEMGQ